MKDTTHIAALDLGTMKMLGVVAEKDSNGALTVVASQELNSESTMRRGCVFNVDQTTTKVSRLISQLNSQLSREIDRLYVGIGGQSLRTESYRVKKEVERGIITREMIDQILEEVQAYSHETAEVLAIVSPEYYLDGQLEANPIGATCSQLEVNYQLILGRRLLKSALKQAVFKKTDVGEVDFFITPIATAEAVLSEKEKELGCALVEFGAGVTYVSVYKSGSLKYLATIPLGGEVITKDIMSLNIVHDEAEEQKITKGQALSSRDEEDNVALVVEARIEEIVANVLAQINYSEYAHNLGAGIIITGGAAQLKDLPEMIAAKMRKEVRLATVRPLLLAVATPLASNPANSAVFGLLSLGEEDCLKEKESIIKVETSFGTSPAGAPPSGTSRPTPPPAGPDISTPSPVEGEEQGELFGEEEVEKITPPAPNGGRKEPRKPKSPSFMDRLKGRVNDLSKDLFDQE